MEGTQSVFLIGGYGSKYEDILNRCDSYSVKQGQWMIAPPLNRARYKHASFAAGSRIFVFGGFNKRRRAGTADLGFVEETEESVELLDTSKTTC